MGVYYHCQRCTACCRWPGQVYVTDDEIRALAQLKQMTEFDFIQQFTKLATDRQGLVLGEQLGGACIFLEGLDCGLQLVKPKQCQDFPNGWNFQGFEKVCRAIPHGVPQS